MKKDLVIVIPIYKENPSKADLFSINSIIEANKSTYDITYVCGHDLDLGKYPEPYNVETFNNDYFNSTDDYSRLLRNEDFYNRFNNYYYMLIFQTDCFVFYPTLFIDEMRAWLNKGFDYIGAPIISSNANWNNVPAVGNGGCSLRNIDTFIRICSDVEAKNGLLVHHKKAELYNKYEDLFFCEGMPLYQYIDFACFRDSVKFAWDMNPDVLYKKGFDFPLFVHAWNKNLPFWREHFNGLTKRDDILMEEESNYGEFWKLYYRL